jgi:hypothetical protein
VFDFCDNEIQAQINSEVVVSRAPCVVSLADKRSTIPKGEKSCFQAQQQSAIMSDDEESKKSGGEEEEAATDLSNR